MTHPQTLPPESDPSGSGDATPPGLRLPTSPFPGLRPFLDYEEMLMHGRQQQVSDVVRRLGRQQRPAADASRMPLTRFVAVVGGSGSGKSSLIRAGVVPYLRQFGIPEAGDLWESVVSTPGTNFQPGADGVLHDSPITRLAAKFERVLRGAHSAQRCDAIAQMLRRDGGLGRMVDEFGPQLNLSSGVRPEDACVLIVIDQFEELFHKTNAGSADAQALVERVIDHFHEAKQGQGSAKCFLAITMRSEHLNDCAGYLGLPEAINSGGYLVSRLGEAQLREVIERPAQRYLRLRQRERQALARQSPPVDLSALPTLPRTVAFEPGVIDDLVAATAQIEHDPDHLPLLQHALARTWAAACAREGLQVSDVPAAIKLVDLWRAGSAQVDPPASPSGKVNLLRLSLNSWAEHTLRSHPDAERAEVLDLMRRLAYKDLRTGSYNQQRLHVSLHPLDADRLHALLQGRWIDEVDYLHWDDEDPQHVTLKVSHESFIRGWQTLNELADREAERLERFMELLEATKAWASDGRIESRLLEQRLLDRMNDDQVDAALGPPGAEHDADADNATWEDWHRWLTQLPRGEPLEQVTRRDVREYMHLSRQRLDQLAKEAQEQAAKFTRAREDAVRAQADAQAARADADRAEAQADAERARTEAERARSNAAETRANAEAMSRRWQRWGMILGGPIALMILYFASVLLVPIMVRSQHFFNAAGTANEASLSVARETIGGGMSDLKKLMRAADELRMGLTPDKNDQWTAWTAYLTDGMPTSPALRSFALATLLPDAAAAVEPSINDRLRQVLTKSIWYVPLPDDDKAVISAIRTTQPEASTCNGANTEQRCTLAVRVGQGMAEPDTRGLVMPNGSGSLPIIPFLSNPAETAVNDCLKGECLFVPLEPGKPVAGLMFDAELRYMLIGEPSGISVLRVDWSDGINGPVASSVGPLAVVSHVAGVSQSVQSAQDQLPEGITIAATTWRTAGGRAVKVGEKGLRLVTETAQLLVPTPDSGKLQEPPVVAASASASDGNADPDCRNIRSAIVIDFKRQFPDQPAPKPVVLKDGETDSGYCLFIQIGARGGADQIDLQVFRHPIPQDKGKNGLRTKQIASVDFGRVPTGTSRRWWTGKEGEVDGRSWKGWLILEQMEAGDQDKRYYGLPWSTDALRRLAEDVCLSHDAATPEKDENCKPGESS